MIHFLGVGYSDIEALYSVNKLSKLFLVVYSLAIVFALLITLYKFGKQIKQDVSKTLNVSTLLNLLYPFIPYYLILFALPLLSGLFETMTNLLVESVANAIPTNGLGDLDQPIQDYLKKKMKNVGNIKILWIDTGISDPFEKFSIWLEELILAGTMPIAHYLYAFALTVYFMWLLVLEAFAPIAALGFVFDEFKSYTSSFIKNMIACKLYLIFLAISNVFSIGMYSLYQKGFTFKDADNLQSLAVVVIFVLMKAMLYKKSWDLSNKII